MMMVLATDHECGEPAIATVNHKGRAMHVCAWHAWAAPHLDRAVLCREL